MVTGQGGIPGGTQTGPRRGRLYILDVHPMPNKKTLSQDGTVLTYYSCFTDNGEWI